MKKFFIFLLAVIWMMVGQVDAHAKEVIDGFSPPEIYIKAVNPGYSIDKVSNVGEMIEIGRGKNSDEPILLTGYSISYTNSSGNSAVLVEFPENSWMVGEKILLRLASSPGGELANLQYTKTLAAKAGPLSIRRGEEVIDEVCWTGKEGCYKDFKSAKPTTLVRNLETGEFEHIEEYSLEYKEENYYVEVEPEVEIPSQCKGLVFSEVLTYYESVKAEQFVELYNETAEQIKMDGCSIRYKNKKYEISGMVQADEYKALYLDELALTKNPTNKNVLEIVDVNEDVVDVLEIPNGQRKGTSFIFVGFDNSGGEIWKVTYAPTPGRANNYQEYKTCEEGKVINPETGNCVKVTEVAAKECKSGYFLNVLTGRCNKIPVVAAKVCKVGYKLNEETGRCVKIKENNGADYKVKKEEFNESSNFIALYLVLGVVGIGIIYIIYEFRQDIVRIWRKVFRRSL